MVTHTPLSSQGLIPLQPTPLSSTTLSTQKISKVTPFLGRQAFSLRLKNSSQTLQASLNVPNNTTATQPSSFKENQEKLTTQKTPYTPSNDLSKTSRPKQSHSQLSHDTQENTTESSLFETQASKVVSNPITEAQEQETQVKEDRFEVPVSQGDETQTLQLPVSLYQEVLMLLQTYNHSENSITPLMAPTVPSETESVESLSAFITAPLNEDTPTVPTPHEGMPFTTPKTSAAEETLQQATPSISLPATQTENEGETAHPLQDVKNLLRPYLEAQGIPTTWLEDITLYTLPSQEAEKAFTEIQPHFTEAPVPSITRLSLDSLSKEEELDKALAEIQPRFTETPEPSITRLSLEDLSKEEGTTQESSSERFAEASEVHIPHPPETPTTAFLSATPPIPQGQALSPEATASSYVHTPVQPQASTPLTQNSQTLFSSSSPIKTLRLVIEPTETPSLNTRSSDASSSSMGRMVLILKQTPSVSLPILSTAENPSLAKPQSLFSGSSFPSFQSGELTGTLFLGTKETFQAIATQEGSSLSGTPTALNPSFQVPLSSHTALTIQHDPTLQGSSSSNLSLSLAESIKKETLQIASHTSFSVEAATTYPHTLSHQGLHSASSFYGVESLYHTLSETPVGLLNPWRERSYQDSVNLTQHESPSLERSSVKAPSEANTPNDFSFSDNPAQDFSDTKDSSQSSSRDIETSGFRPSFMDSATSGNSSYHSSSSHQEPPQSFGQGHPSTKAPVLSENTLDALIDSTDGLPSPTNHSVTSSFVEPITSDVAVSGVLQEILSQYETPSFSLPQLQESSFSPLDMKSLDSVRLLLQSSYHRPLSTH
ncbi:MAG: hypothetical protein ACKO37_04495 [Vampirovibrionales bacterium]